MKRVLNFIFGVAVVAAASIVSTAPASAQSWPTQRVTIVVPFGAGSVTDILARIFAEEMGRRWGQQVVVENRPGLAGTTAVGKSTPDGYTLMVTSNGHTVAGLVSKTLTVDPVKDFAGITRLGSAPLFLITYPGTPVKTLKDVIELAKKEPGKLTIGSPPPPTLNYFGAEQFKAMTGIDVSIVTYKGTGPLTNDLVGGHVMLAFNTLPPAIGNIQVGKLKAIAVCAPERLAAIPDVPTAAEAGLPGLDVVLYYGLTAPAGTPRPIIERLNKELRAIVTSDEFKKRIVADGGGPAPSTPEEHGANIAREEAKWNAIIKKLGLKLE